jgi:ABC-type transport system substrate-binding protein
MRSVTRRSRTIAALVAMCTAVLVLAAGCGSSSKTGSNQNASKAPQRGGSLVVGISAETNGWNPAYAQWADTGSLVGSSVLEPLARQGTDNGAKPWLAKSWIANDSFTRWVINLQPNIQFQDGEPFNADAVVQNIKTYANGPLSSLAIGPMFADEKALSDLQVEIDLTQPWAAFPSSFMQGGSAYMMAPAMMNASDHGASHPIGTGPFTFDSWTPNSTFKANRNPHYWGGLDDSGNRRTGLPYLDSIEFKVIPEESARQSALQAGDVSMIYTSDATVEKNLASSFDVVRDWTTENVYVMTNTAPATASGKPNPLANADARLALVYATDRNAIANSIGKGIQVPTSPWSPTNPWGQPDAKNGYPDFDLTKAKAAVAKYERETGQTSLSFTLSGLPGVAVANVLQQLQTQWKAAGITVNIETLEQTAYITKIASGDYQAAFFRNYGYPDPDQDYYFWSSTTAKGVGKISINFTQATNPQMEQDLTVGRQNGFVSARKTAYHDLARQLNATATNIWLYRTPYSFIAQKKVHGLDVPNGPAHIAFGNFEPKVWLGTLWVDQSG